MPNGKKQVDFKRIAEQISIVDLAASERGIAAKKMGNDYFLEACPFCGGGRGKYKNFAIQVSEPHKGKCFKCGWSGDSVAFLAECRTITMAESAKILSGEWRQPERQAATWGKSSGEPDKEKRIWTARKIFEQAKPITEIDADALLEKRHFPQALRATAAQILSSIGRINTHKEKRMLVIPQASGDKVCGLCRISLENPSDKRDIGKKGFTPLPGNGGKLVIVESWWNALCLSAVGIDAVAVYSCSNHAAIAEAVAAYREEYEIAFWLDAGMEEKQAAYCREFGLPGIWFDGQPSGYDINDLLRDNQADFAAIVAQHIESACMPADDDQDNDQADGSDPVEPIKEKIDGGGEIFDHFPLSAYLTANCVVENCPACGGMLDLTGEIYSKCGCKENDGIRDVVEWHALLNGTTKDEATKFLLEKIREAESQLEDIKKQHRKALGLRAQSEEPETRDFANRVCVSVREAFQSALTTPEKMVLVQAATGSGKSTLAAEIAIQRMLKGEPTLYSAAFTRDMQQFYNQVITALRENKLDHLLPRITVCAMGEEQTPGKETLIAITNQTRITRKGFTTQHFSIIPWIERAYKDTGKRVLVIIDEAAKYCEKQVFSVPSGTRYAWKYFKNTSKPRCEFFTECPANKNKGNCENCEISQENILPTNNFGIYEILPFVEGRSQTGPKENPFARFEINLETCGIGGSYKTLTAQNVYRGPYDINRRAYTCEPEKGQDGKAKDVLPSVVIDDLVNCSWAPRVYTHSPIDLDGNQVTREQIVNARKKSEEAGKKKGPKFNFPSLACAIRWYSLPDRSSLSYIANHSEKVLLLNTPFEDDCAEIEFMRACANGDFAKVIATESGHKLKEFALFVYSKRFLMTSRTGKNTVVNVQAIIDAFSRGENILAFEEKESSARTAFSEMPENFPAGFLGARTTDKIETRDDEPARLNFTHPNGALAQAINRPKDRGVFANGKIHQPAYSLRPGIDLSEETINEARRKATTRKAVQIIGRILRVNPEYPGHRKFGVLHAVGDKTEIDEAMILRNIQDMVETPVKYLFVEESQEYLTKAILQYLADGTFPEQSEADFLVEQATEKGIEKGMDNLSKAQKEMADKGKVKLARKANRQSLSFFDKKKEAEKMGRYGEPWREVCRKLNVRADKFSAREIKAIKSAWEAAKKTAQEANKTS